MEQSTLAILIIGIGVVLFATEIIPIPVTAIVTALAMTITGVIKYPQAYASFGATATVFTAAMMVVGNACFDNGLAQEVGNALKRFNLGRNEKLMICVFCATAGIMSAFMSNSAVVAMLIPLVATLVMQSDGKAENKNILMAVGIGSGMGGVCTLSGSTPQVIAQGILESNHLPTMTYFQLAKAGAPLVIIMVLYFATIGYFIEKKVLTFKDVVPVAIDNSSENSVTYDKRKGHITAVIVILTLLCFILGVWNITIVSMTSVALLLLTHCISLKKAFWDIDWNTILVLAGSQAFAKGLDTSGAGIRIANGFLAFLGNNATPFAVLAVLIIVSTILTNFMSNASIAVMLVPIAIQLAKTLDCNVLTFVIGIVISSQLAFATPVGTPCVTQTMVGGYKYMDYVKVGLPLTVILMVVAIFLIPAVYGL